METKIFEAVTKGSHGNWGKFLVGLMDHEHTYVSEVDGPEYNPSRGTMLRRIGWHSSHVWVMDLQTKEGAAFVWEGGYAKADLNKHRIWVCPLFEPFLTWLYQELKAGKNVMDLPALVELEAPVELYGYRREGAEA